MIKLKPIFNKYQLTLYAIALLSGLGIAVSIFNYRQNKLVKFDVTWVDPHQAIIFWKTPNKVKGYIKYGSQKLKLSQQAEQTNQQASVLHVVVLDNLAPGEVFMTLHSQPESFFRRPRVFSIKYQAPENEP